jgi:hypothetical protein
MRQPKIYIRLPSNGKYWPEGSIDIPDNGEFPVYSLTAKDELTLKTPDALLNGQAVVDIIQSCFPNIKNAWHTPNIDIDTLLVALRIASYGEMMEINHIVPGTKDDVTHTIDLRLILDQLTSAGNWQENILVSEDMMICVRPLTYKHVSENSSKTFEAQRLIQLISDGEITEDRREELLNLSVNNLATIAFDVVADSIYMIKTQDVEVVDKEFIKEFLQNADKEIYNKVEQHLIEMKNTIGIKPLDFNSSPEHIEQGAPASYSMPLNMDQSSFFVVGS